MMNRKRAVLIAGIALTVVAVVVIIFMIINQKPADVSNTVVAVGRHYLLPNEEPAIATVEDKTKVSSQFLQSAEDGDKLLIYKDAKKVILYRPSIDKIIEVGPVSIAPTNDESASKQ